MLRAQSLRQKAARLATAAVLAAAFVVLGAAPAAAHGLAGTQPTNFASRVQSITPNVPGLQVRVRDLGAKIEVRNDSRSEVEVLGYEGEPYLRVGPSGVYQNRRSPSVFLNRSPTVTAPAPPAYDAHAAPVWRRTGGGHTVAWHDHRVHWMGTSLPPAVRDSPGHAHLVANWVVTLRYRGHDIAVRGALFWIPGPSALPRLGLAFLVAALVIGLGFTRRWGSVLLVTLLVVAALVTVLIAGEWSATTGGVWTAFLSTVYSILGVAVALAAAGALLRSRREPDDAIALVLVAAVVVTFGSGLADVTVLDRSQLPTTLSGPVARTFVAVVLGAGVGVLVTAARKLRRPTLVSAPAAPSASRPPRLADPGE
jgi:hypothetical protein